MKSSLTSIKEASFARRALAVVMDAIFFVFTFVFLMTVVMTPVANGTVHYDAMQASAARYQLVSKLYIAKGTNENGESVIIDLNTNPDINLSKVAITSLPGYESDDIEFYRSNLKYYYLNYKTGEGISVPAGYTVDSYRAPDYDQLITLENGEKKLPKDVYTEDWFNEKFGGYTTIDELKKAIIETALPDFFYSSYYQELQDGMKKAQLLILIPSYVISFGLFYILAPALFKNGETLAKKFLSIGFVTKDGYQIKKRQIILRQIAGFCYITIFPIIAYFIDSSLSLVTVAFMLFGGFIYFLLTFLNKEKRSFLDMFAYVSLIDTKSSVWFKDPEEETRKEEEFNSNMSKYRRGPVENKNLIQIGGTIIDEDIKREVEEENLKKIKK